MSRHQLVVGAHVVFVTSERQLVNALVEVVHTVQGQSAEEHRATYGNLPCINVLYLQPSEDMKDQHGRQKGHASSVCHGSQQGVPQGYCWLWPDEVADLVPGERRVFDDVK